MMRTLRMSNPIKARHIVLGARGEKSFEVVPSPKPIVEFHWWVLVEKLKAGGLVVMAFLIGAVAIMLGWKALLVVMVIGFIVGFAKGGDIETGPPRQRGMD